MTRRQLLALGYSSEAISPWELAAPRRAAERLGAVRSNRRPAGNGLTPLRFTRAQVRFEPAHVQATLTAVCERLRGL